ncbi:hypothetical protein [Oerskovia sp. Root918]|uniref:hypothetical protein n=1 Tax=Oerskovia sp. Root918 TaxID=1736607 RepID=UPI000A96DC5B|nr:hypothetical protein [Oerskovia sp. Root918]
MSDTLAIYSNRDTLLEMADMFETVAATSPTQSAPAGHTVPGPRLPPGLAEILDVDELDSILTAITEWAEFLAHVLLDEVDAPDAGTTPGRLRSVAQHVAHLLEHDDQLLALAFADDLDEHARTLRHLARRGVRTYRTGCDCQDGTCDGQYEVAMSGTYPPAVCPRCHDVVPWSVWSSWPHKDIVYVTVEHAARLAGTTVAGVKMRASRGGWRKTGTGREVKYHVDDVRGVDVTTHERISA